MDNPYWAAMEQMQATKQKKKETACRIKKEEDRLKEWINTSQSIANNLEYDLKVITDKKILRKKNYIVFYIYKESRNDWYLYLELARVFWMIIGGKVELRHIIDIDEYYATY